MFDRLIDLFIELAMKLRFFTVVNCYEKGIVLRFGKLVRELEPGLRWLIPLAERPVVVSVVPWSVELEESTLQSQDGHTVLVSLIVTWKVVDVARYELKTASGYNSVSEAVRAPVALIVASTTFDNLSTGKWLDDLLPLCQERATPWGVEVDSISAANLTSVQAVRAFGVEVSIGE